MNELGDLLRGRPGWRLEPMATPGSTAVWCFVTGGRIEFSVTADHNVIQLYLIKTDMEIVFQDADELTTWLRTHRAEALQEPVSRLPGKSRLRKIVRWG